MLKTLIVGLIMAWVAVAKLRKPQTPLDKALKGFKPLKIEKLRALKLTTTPCLVLFHSYRGIHQDPSFTSYAKAPKYVKKYLPKVALFAFDCFAKPLACADLGVQRYPTLMLFANNNKYVFNPPYEFSVLQEWLDSILFVKAFELTSSDQIETLKSSQKALPALLFCGTPSHPHFRPFDQLSKSRAHREEYYYVSNPELHISLNCTLGDTLYLSPDKMQKTNIYPSHKPYSLLRFLLSSRYPKVRLLNFFSYQAFFDKHRPMMIYFAQEMTEDVLRDLNKLADHIPNVEVYYLFGKGERPHGAGVLGRKLERMLDIEIEFLPAVRVVKVGSKGAKKYKMVGELTPEAIIKFVQSVMDKKVKPSIKSQSPKKHRKHFLVGLLLAETGR